MMSSCARDRCEILAETDGESMSEDCCVCKRVDEVAVFITSSNKSAIAQWARAVERQVNREKGIL